MERLHGASASRYDEGSAVGSGRRPYSTMLLRSQMTFRAPWRCQLALAIAVIAGGCTETLDAGYNDPSGLLPVDQRNPLILLNDGAYDNWSGEYAVLLANGGGSPLAAIIVNETSAWPDIQT